MSNMDNIEPYPFLTDNIGILLLNFAEMTRTNTGLATSYLVKVPKMGRYHYVEPIRNGESIWPISELDLPTDKIYMCASYIDLIKI